jgi:hypothetical protein
LRLYHQRKRQIKKFFGRYIIYVRGEILLAKGNGMRDVSGTGMLGAVGYIDVPDDSSLSSCPPAGSGFGMEKLEVVEMGIRSRNGFIIPLSNNTYKR